METKLNKRQILRHVVCALMAGAGTPAMAQQRLDLTALPIEQLLNLEVSTASKIPQKISEAPSSVSVILAEEIRQHGYRSLADILQGVRGMSVSYDRMYHYAGARGMGQPGDLNTRILILVDGRRLNDVVYDQGAIGTEFPIDVSLIERVEFVPGPGSALYGSSAFWGVVNVITRKGASYHGAEVAVGAASHGGRQARATYGAPVGGRADFLLSYAWHDKDGKDLYFPEFDDRASNNGVATGLDYDRYLRAFAKLSYGGLSAHAYAARRNKGMPTAAYGQHFNDPRSRMVDNYTGAAVSYQRKLSDTLDVFGSVDLAHYRYRGIFVYERDSPSSNLDLSHSRSAGAELRLSSTAWRGHRLIAGAEYRRDTRRSMRNYDVEPFVAHLHVDRPKTRTAFYLQDEMRLGERLILNAGLRHDHDSEGGNATNPRLALLYKATPAITFKGLYGTAFRAANAYERYYATSSDYKLNPSLRSEWIRTYELISEYFPTDRFRASASLFQYRLRDMLALTIDPQDGLLYFSNIDAARSRGLELEAEWMRDGGVTLKTSASLQSARNRGSGEWLSNSPRRLFKFRYAAPLLGERVRAGIEYQFTGPRRVPAGGQVGGFGVVNLTLLSQSSGNTVELSASVYNLFNKRYADPASEEHFDNGMPPRHLHALQRDGRSWRILASVRF